MIKLARRSVAFLLVTAIIMGSIGPVGADSGILPSSPAGISGGSIVMGPGLQSTGVTAKEFGGQALTLPLLQRFRKSLHLDLSAELLRATRDALRENQVHRLPVATIAMIQNARTTLISDLHIANPFAQEQALSDMLHQIVPDPNPSPQYQRYLIVAGDTVDHQKILRKRLYRQGARLADIISTSAKAAIKRINVLAARGVLVTILFGNHDAHYRTIYTSDQRVGDLEVKPLRHLHKLADGRTALIVHGDGYDGIDRQGREDTSFGGYAYDALQLLDYGLNRLFPKKAWSLLAIKPFVPFVARHIAIYNLRLVEAAKAAGAQVVITGHVHMPYRMVWEGIEILNMGDWVENAVFILEDFTTGLHLVRWDTHAPRPAPVRLKAKLSDPHAPFSAIYRPPYDVRNLDPKDKFDALTEVQARDLANKIDIADVIVGIPFHDETENIGPLVQSVKEDLEARGNRAAILVIGEFEEKDNLPQYLNDDSSDIRVYCLTKPPPEEFMQPPGPGRRAWSQRLAARIAARLKADVVFMNANEREADGRVPLFLNKLQGGDKGPLMVTADYEGEFSSHEAIVYIWDDLFYGAMFGAPIRHREEGEFALSRKILPTFMEIRWLRYGLVYDLESQFASYLTRDRRGPQTIRLPAKRYALVETSSFLTERLPLLVKSAFEDARIYWFALTDVYRRIPPPRPRQQSEESRRMKDLIGNYPDQLDQDFVRTFDLAESALEEVLGPDLFLPFHEVRHRERLAHQITPQTWAEATFRFLERYRNADTDEKREAYSNAYVPVLELGALAYFDRTKELSYEAASQALERDFLPAFKDLRRQLAENHRKIRNRRPRRGAPHQPSESA